jgi:polysaccharide pyruvyl transferase WcaK-like protein
VHPNDRHLAMSETRQLGGDVSKAGAFLDRIYQHAPARTRQALAKSLVDLKNPPYSRAELVAALRLHGAIASANGLEVATL